jgi:hypothetical protein
VISISLLFFFTMLPDLNTIDDILPEDVTARPYGGERIQVGRGKPDGKGGVLLSQGLP